MEVSWTRPLFAAEHARTDLEAHNLLRSDLLRSDRSSDPTSFDPTSSDPTSSDLTARTRAATGAARVATLP